MHVRYRGQRAFAQPPGEPDKIRTHATFAVVALRMRRVVGHGNQRCVSIPQTQQTHIGIDDALGGLLGLGLAAGTVADDGHLAVGAQNASIGRHLSHAAHAQAQMSHLAAVLSAVADRGRQPSDGLAGRLGVEHPAAQAVRNQ